MRRVSRCFPTLAFTFVVRSFASIIYLLFGCLIPWVSIDAVEPPQLTRLMPFGAQVGHETAIEAIGSFKSWPVQVWCSDSRVVWTAQPDAGKFLVKIPDSMEEGTVWFRFFNSAGVSQAKRLGITKARPDLEKEPNQQIAAAHPIEIGQEMYGVLEKNGDVDLYQFHLEKGSQVSAIVDAARMGSPLDAHLQLLNSRGFVLAENMDHFGYDPALSFVAPNSGTYLLRVFGFPIEPDSTISFRGGAEWCYRIRCNGLPIPFEPPTPRKLPSGLDSIVGESIGEAPKLSVSDSRFGIISKPRSTHYYQLPPSHGKTLRLELFAQSMGSRLDPTMTVIDRDGKQQVFQDDNQTNRDPSITWTMPGNGEYYIAITDFHNQASPQHAYWLVTDELLPGLSLKAGDAFKGKTNEPIELSTSIERIANWTGECECLLSEAPEGTTIEPSRFRVEKDTKSIVFKLSLTKAYQGPLPIRFRKVDTDVMPQTIQGPTDAGCWLTVEEASKP